MACSRDTTLIKNELIRYISSLGITVKTVTKARGNKGFFKEGRIDVSKNLDDDSAVRVLVHEFSHYINYKLDNKLQNLKTVLGNDSEIIRKELSEVTKFVDNNAHCHILNAEKERLKTKIKSLTDTIKNVYPKFSLSEEFKEFKRYAGWSDLAYLEKYDRVEPVRWHLIGHLQTNKVKNVIGKVVMIHSVDSAKLAREINKRSEAAGLVTDILIEINSAMEESKSGIDSKDLKQLTEDIVKECANVRVRGLMCIPPMAADPEDARPYFKEAASLFEEMKNWDLPKERFIPDVLSMGMSGDFEVAIEEGATIVRVGSSIFGPRNYR